VKWPGFEIQLLRDKRLEVNDVDIPLPAYEDLYEVRLLGDYNVEGTLF
jgi:hypothetical protein